MKKTVLLFCAAFIICTSQQVSAKIWRVNNNGYSADFAQLKAANDNNNVLSGDTIHLESSATAYNSVNINKKLIIIGSGYFLAFNLNTSYNKIDTKISNINFINGSDGSELIGVYVADNANGIGISANNITIKRCAIDATIGISPYLTNIKIIQNIFTSKYPYSIISTNANGFASDLIFDNNIIKRTLILPYNTNYTISECNNNIFDVSTATPAIQLYAGTFYNNILTNPNATVSINGGDYTYVDYNISASANNQFGSSNHNIVVSDTSTLFIGGTSPDGRYQLKTNSPAKANGSDGTDRGVFGGGAAQNWYTLSGLAPIPVIYKITSGGVGSGSLPITIQARTIK